MQLMPSSCRFTSHRCLGLQNCSIMRIRTLNLTTRTVRLELCHPLCPGSHQNQNLNINKGISLKATGHQNRLVPTKTDFRISPILTEIKSSSEMKCRKLQHSHRSLSLVRVNPTLHQSKNGSATLRPLPRSVQHRV